MSELTEETARQPENVKIRDWRIKVLEHAGYSAIHAREIAARDSGLDAIDLHEAIGLVANGCPPHLAAEILL